MKQGWLNGTLALALASALLSAQAHNFHAGITDVSYNARTGSTEVVHTYMAHDIDALLTNLYQRQFDLSAPEDQDVLRKYVEQQFSLHDRDHRKLALRWVGMTVDAQSVVIYQEAQQTPLAKAASVHDEVMTDFLPDQVNTVNINEAGGVHTLTFDGKAAEQPIR
ncbi:MAG: DUF6702 family protein [Telluria sp.]